MGLVQFIDGKVVYYPYLPSKAAALAFVALFAVATLSHIGLMIRYRSWFFIPLVIGGICKFLSMIVMMPTYRTKLIFATF